MSRSTSIWAVLGLGPTKDARAIRKAYSVRLKAIDVDADPAAFVELRHAFEAALAYSEYAEPAPSMMMLDQFIEATAADQLTGWANLEEGPPADPDTPTSPDLVRPAHAPSTDRAPRPERPQAEAYAGSPADRTDLNRLQSLLHADVPIDDAGPEIRALARRILSDAAKASIDRAEDIEHWLADLIADTIPRSDAMAQMVIDHFHWRGADRVWRQSDQVRLVLQRQDDLVFLRDISRTGHALNRAYRALKRRPVRWLDRLDMGLKRDVRTLLTAIRTRHFTLYPSLDPQIVDGWDRRLSRPSVGDGLWGVAAKVLPGGERIWLAPAHRRLGLWGWLGILIIPHIRAWQLLGKGFSARARLVGFTWLVIMSAFYVAHWRAQQSHDAAATAADSGMTIPTLADAEAALPKGCRFVPALNGSPNQISCPLEGGKVQTATAPDGFDASTVGFAADGNVQSMALLGEAYLHGPPVMQSRPLAAKWFRKAADAGNAWAMVALGLLNATDKGVDGSGRNLAEAARWYFAAAAKGDAEGRYRFADQEELGLARPKDVADAARLYALSAQQGFAPAQARLGELYATGEGGPKNLDKAEQLLKMAVAAGDANGMLWLADLYRGRGDHASAMRAIDLYKRAIGKGAAGAWVDLGVLYVRGRGVAQDPIKAAAAFQHGVDAGQVAAMYDLALLYKDGAGVPRNDAMARDLMRRAAILGFEPAATAFRSMP